MQQDTAAEPVFRQVAGPIDDLAVLAFLGVESSDPRAGSLLRVLSVGLIHESYIGGHYVPGVTPGILRAFGAIGKAWVRREFATRVFEDRWYLSDRQQSELAAAAWKHFASQAANSAFESLVLATRPHPGYSSQVLIQVLGALVYANEYGLVKRLFNGAMMKALDAEADSDYMSPEFNLLLPERARVWSGTPGSGPAIGSNVATLTDTAGRAVSVPREPKKTAYARLASEYLRKHRGSVNAFTAERTRAPSRLRGAAPPWQRQVESIVIGFDFAPSWIGLVDQAFVHSSWIESPKSRGSGSAEQEDNRRLALVGAAVIRLERSRAVACRAIRESAPGMPELALDAVTAAGAAELPIGDLLLHWRKGRVRGEMQEMVDECFRGLLGALHIARGQPVDFFAKVPDRWNAIRHHITAVEFGASGSKGIDGNHDRAPAAVGGPGGSTQHAAVEPVTTYRLKRLTGQALHAFELVTSHYEAAGYRVDYVAGQRPYDLDVRCGDEHVHVKVALGQQDGAIALTAGEKAHFSTQYPNTVLAVVCSTLTPEGTEQMSRRQLDLTFPWRP